MDSLKRDDHSTAESDVWFLSDTSEVSNLLRRLSAQDCPLGAPAAWSRSLQTLVATMLPVKAQIVLFWGPDYVALYNDAYAPTIGAKHPRALGRPAVENWSELWDDLEPLLRGVRETGETFSAKDRPFYIQRSARGEVVYFDVSYSAVRAEDGSIGGVLCIVTETTQRVQFEELQAFLVQLGHSFPAFVEPEQIETHLLNALSAKLRPGMLCLGRTEDNGGTFLPAQVHEGGRLLRHCVMPAWHGVNLQRLRTGQALYYWNDDVHVDESVHAPFFLEQAIPARIDIPLLRDGRLAGVLTFKPDPAKEFGPHQLRLAIEAAGLAWLWMNHASAEMAVRVSSRQLSAMFDQASAGIAVCDVSSKLERINERYCQMLGCSGDATTLGSLDRLMRGEAFSPMRPEFERALYSGVPFESTQRYRRQDGTDVWIQNHVTPIRDGRDRYSRLLCVGIDVSARIEAENELRRLNDELERRVGEMVAEREKALAQLHESRKMEMVGQIGGGVAHDFNNLLTPIITSMELIKRRVTDERISRLVDGALQAADRARVLVGRLLTFARRQTLRPEPTQLARLIHDLTDLIERSLGPTIPVTLNIDAELPNVLVDAHQLELAILNLAVNARDAMPQGGHLVISATHATDAAGKGLADGDYVKLSVQDNGCGMAEDVLRKCVEPFYSTKGAGKGTGLGLSMVQGLALQSGGAFDLTSRPGAGTTVSLWLPTTCEAVRPEEHPQVEAPTAQAKTHILLVDDENLVRQSTALLLRDLGYQVTESSSATEALAKVADGLLPDLLLSDQVMADRSGLQLAHQLRAQFPHLPVLIITGYTHIELPHGEGFELLTKPFSREDIASRILHLLKGREAAG